MKNIFFSEFEEEFTWSKESIIEEMKERELTEVKVWTSKRLTGQDFFYCKELMLVGEKNDYICGKKWCDKYIPRNGRSGICKHWGYTYEPDKEFILTIDGKLK